MTFPKGESKHIVGQSSERTVIMNRAFNNNIVSLSSLTNKLVTVYSDSAKFSGSSLKN